MSLIARAARGSRQSMVATAVALGWAKLWRARIAFDDAHDLFICSSMRGGFARGGTTIGGVYLTRNCVAPHTIRHEAVHADQWARYGLSFIALYLFEEVRHRKTRNRFEVEAGLADGGYGAPVDEHTRRT